MEFVVLLTEPDSYGRWEVMSEEEQKSFFADLEAFEAAVSARGRVVAGAGLAHPSEARTLGPGPDRSVTEGPYAEAAEQLGGFYLIDVPDRDAALEVSALLPAQVTVEIRPTANE